MIEWRSFVAEEREKQLMEIIRAERLNETETRKYLEDAFRDGAPLDIYFEGATTSWPTSIKKMRDASCKINAVHCDDGDIE